MKNKLVINCPQNLTLNLNSKLNPKLTHNHFCYTIHNLPHFFNLRNCDSTLAGDGLQEIDAKRNKEVVQVNKQINCQVPKDCHPRKRHEWKLITYGIKKQKRIQMEHVA